MFTINVRDQTGNTNNTYVHSHYNSLDKGINALVYFSHIDNNYTKYTLNYTLHVGVPGSDDIVFSHRYEATYNGNEINMKNVHNINDNVINTHRTQTTTSNVVNVNTRKSVTMPNVPITPAVPVTPKVPVTPTVSNEIKPTNRVASILSDIKKKRRQIKDVDVNIDKLDDIYSTLYEEVQHEEFLANEKKRDDMIIDDYEYEYDEYDEDDELLNIDDMEFNNEEEKETYMKLVRQYLDNKADIEYNKKFLNVAVKKLDHEYYEDRCNKQEMKDMEKKMNEEIAIFENSKSTYLKLRSRIIKNPESEIHLPLLFKEKYHIIRFMELNDLINLTSNAESDIESDMYTNLYQVIYANEYEPKENEDGEIDDWSPLDKIDDEYIDICSMFMDYIDDNEITLMSEFMCHKKLNEKTDIMSKEIFKRDVTKEELGYVEGGEIEEVE